MNLINEVKLSSLNHCSLQNEVKEIHSTSVKCGYPNILLVVKRLESTLAIDIQPCTHS